MGLGAMVLVGEAHAQPAPDVKPPEPMAPAPAPPTSTTVPMPPPPPAEAPSKYPTAQAQRPLLLPTGAAEGGLRLRMTIQDFGDESLDTLVTEPHGRYGLGSVEIEATAQLFVAQWLPDSVGTFEPQRLQSLAVAGRYLLDPNRSVGAEVTVGTPVAELRLYRPMLTLQHKSHLSATSAVELRGGAGAELLRFDTGGGSQSATSLALEGSARLQAQLSPGVAVEGLVGMRHARSLDGEDAGFIQTLTTFDLEVGVVGSIAPGVDLAGAIGIITGDQIDQKVITLGVVTRRVP